MQLVALEVVLAVGVVVMYGTEVTGVALLVATCLAATAGLAAAGTLYGVLAAGLRVRETLLPILLLPVLAPVLIGATKAFEAALGGAAADGWPWCGLLVAFALLYTALRHPRLRPPPGGDLTAPRDAAPSTSSPRHPGPRRPRARRPGAAPRLRPRRGARPTSPRRTRCGSCTCTCPTAILAFVACSITTVASAMWLRRRSEGWWVLGGAAAEVGLVFTGICLLTGSIWGRPTWGTYWDWDPRITSTTLLFILLVGYLALRRIDNEAGDAAQRGMRGADRRAAALPERADRPLLGRLVAVAAPDGHDHPARPDHRGHDALHPDARRSSCSGWCSPGCSCTGSASGWLEERVGRQRPRRRPRGAAGRGRRCPSGGGPA